MKFVIMIDIINDIKRIVEENNNKNKFNLILDISDKLELTDDDEITLIYKRNINDERIKIFNSEFVNNNKIIVR